MKLVNSLLNRPLLILTIVFLLFVLINYRSFIENVLFYASGSVAAFTIKGQWWLVTLNIVVFLSLLLFLGRRNINWKTHGLFSAFIVSLFVEMYGVSLLLYFISDNVIGKIDLQPHTFLFDVNFFGVYLTFDLWMTFGAVVIITGMTIIALGWYQLWKSKKTLFIEGLYKGSRHPQYVGFLYTIWGWMIAWPTFTTLIFTPILTIAYLNAAKKEEEYIMKQNREYNRYKNKTPFLL